MNSFLFNHLKFQIASLVILVILEVIYFMRPKIKLLSNRIFTVLMVSSFCYLIFDFATVLGPLHRFLNIRRSIRLIGLKFQGDFYCENIFLAAEGEPQPT